MIIRPTSSVGTSGRTLCRWCSVLNARWQMRDSASECSGFAGISSIDMLASLRQLLDDGRQVEPDLLARNLAVARELDHVEQPELQRPVPAVEAERPARRPPLPERLVD